MLKNCFLQYSLSVRINKVMKFKFWVAVKTDSYNNTSESGVTSRNK